MKKNLLITLLVATSFGNCFSASTIAERGKLIEGLKIDPGKAIEAVNKQQQDGSLKVDDQHYMVVLEKISDKKYTRVAHAKKENVGKDVETSLLKVVEDAEKKLNESGGDGPVSFKFMAENKDIYAVVFRDGKYITFNISNDKKEVDAVCGIKEEPQKAEENPKKEDNPTQTNPKVAEKTTEAVQGQESPAKEASKTEEGAASENPPADDNSAKKDSGTTQDKGAN